MSDGLPVPGDSSADILRRLAGRWRETPAGCWEWTGYVNPQGYGCLIIKGRSIRAHRAAYVAANGQITDGRQVNHHCDNRRCVNPSHLYLGTQSQNIRDAISRNRLYVPDGGRGSSHSQAALTAEQANDIARLYATGKYTQADLGARFGICQARVSQIVRGASGYDVEVVTRAGRGRPGLTLVGAA